MAPLIPVFDMHHSRTTNESAYNTAQWIAMDDMISQDHLRIRTPAYIILPFTLPPFSIIIMHHSLFPLYTIEIIFPLYTELDSLSLTLATMVIPTHTSIGLQP
jgi:hypothetical protein